MLGSKKSMYSLLLLTSFGVASCGGGGDDDSNNNETSVVGTVYDAATGQPVEAKLKFIGEDKDRIDGSLPTTAEDGSFVVEIKDSDQPSTDDPLHLVVEAYAEGYALSGGRIYLTSKGDFSVDISLVDFDNPPNGTSYKQESLTTDASGNIATGLVVTTNPQDAAGNPLGIARVELEANTQASYTDANSTQQVLNGELDVRLIYYNAATNDEDNLAPQGFTIEDISGDSIAGNDTLVVASGFLLEVLDANGNKAELLDPPARIRLDLASSWVFAGNQYSVQEGQAVDIWVYDESGTGTWRPKAQNLVAQFDGENYFVEYDMDLDIIGGAVVAGAVIVENNNDNNGTGGSGNSNQSN